MASTHVVALFLPNTLKFEDATRTEEPSSPPAAPVETTVETTNDAVTKKRSSLRLELPRTGSSTSLFKGDSPAKTPSIDNQEFFAPMNDEIEENTVLQVAYIDDPRSLVQSDAEVPTWGINQPFNQPVSSAAPLPSSSIIDFAYVHMKLKEEQKRRSMQTPTPEPEPKSPTPEPTPTPLITRPVSKEYGYATKTWTVVPPIQGNGALTNAMRAYASSSNIEICWIGTLGFPTDSLPHSMREQIHDRLLNEYQCEVVYASDKDIDGHYSGYCKTILWPIFHYSIPDRPKNKAYADHSWEFYERVNQAFADKVVNNYKKGDTIWINDYHLLLVPGMVRKMLPEAPIGFFLHTPFPSSEVFRILPKRKELLRGMLGANLVAFQTQEYIDHFLQTCNRVLTVETTKEGVQFGERFVSVTAQPMGITPDAMHQARQEEDVYKWINELSDRFGERKLIVNRSKLDSVHGIRQTLLAYEVFLNKYTQWAKKTTLIQVATSTTEQNELLTACLDVCTRIDKKHASLMNTPLVFLKQDISLSQYLALLTSADVLISTTLRDGMNLMGAEFIQCQDGLFGGKKHGPLILSEFAGSAVVLHGHLSINPWNLNQMAAALHQGLEMNEAEKQARWEHLHATATRRTGTHWAEELNWTLEKVVTEQNQRASSAIPRLSIPDLKENYAASSRRLIFLDYEGTLAPLNIVPGESYQQSHSLWHTIHRLTRDNKNTVFIMSGHSTTALDTAFRYADRTGIIAENGCFVHDRLARVEVWESNIDLDKIQQWKKAVRSTLHHFQHNMEGATIEERPVSFYYDYSKCIDPITALRLAGECADQINSTCKTLGIHAVPIDKAILIQYEEIHKGFAANKIFEALRSDPRYADAVDHNGAPLPPDFVMVVGDSREDEPVFRWANGLASQWIVPSVFTVSMGVRNTSARAALPQGRAGLLAVVEELGGISHRLDTPVENWEHCRDEVM